MDTIWQMMPWWLPDKNPYLEIKQARNGLNSICFSESSVGKFCYCLHHVEAEPMALHRFWMSLRRFWMSCRMSANVNCTKLIWCSTCLSLWLQNMRATTSSMAASLSSESTVLLRVLHPTCFVLRRLELFDMWIGCVELCWRCSWLWHE